MSIILYYTAIFFFKVQFPQKYTSSSCLLYIYVGGCVYEELILTIPLSSEGTPLDDNNSIQCKL